MRMMVKLLAAALALFAAGAACYGEDTAPSQAALDAACAVASLHDSMMRDYYGEDYSFANLAGASDIYALFSDSGDGNFLMVGFDDAQERAATAVIQSYDAQVFAARSLTSLRALYLPFCPDDERDEFEQWLRVAAYEAVKAAEAGVDYELNYHYGEFAACALSVYTGGERPLITALVDWYAPLAAEDITELME